MLEYIKGDKFVVTHWLLQRWSSNVYLMWPQKDINHHASLFNKQFSFSDHAVRKGWW